MQLSCISSRCAAKLHIENSCIYIYAAKLHIEKRMPQARGNEVPWTHSEKSALQIKMKFWFCLLLHYLKKHTASEHSHCQCRHDRKHAEVHDNLGQRFCDVWNPLSRYSLQQHGNSVLDSDALCQISFMKDLALTLKTQPDANGLPTTRDLKIKINYSNKTPHSLSENFRK